MSELNPMDRISALFDAIIEKADNRQDMEDDLETVTRQLGYFPNYLATWNSDVINEARDKRLLAAGHLETKEYQDRRTNSDNARHNAHNVMLGACSQLNRLCHMYGVEPFCPDPEKMHRSDIAQFAGQFVCETCGIDLRGRTLDTYIYESVQHPEDISQLKTDDLEAEFDRYIETVKTRAASHTPRDKTTEKEREQAL